MRNHYQPVFLQLRPVHVSDGGTLLAALQYIPKESLYHLDTTDILQVLDVLHLFILSDQGEHPNLSFLTDDQNETSQSLFERLMIGDPSIPLFVRAQMDIQTQDVKDVQLISNRLLGIELTKACKERKELKDVIL